MKKSICLLSITINLIFLFASPALAQHQRLGIAPQPVIHLNSQKQSVEVEAFCLDRHKLIDNRYDYSHVLASNSSTVVTVGERRLTLQGAINEGLIKVFGQSSRFSDSRVMSLRFVSLTNLPVKIEILEPLAMGENPGRFNNPKVLASLKKTQPLGADRKLKQDEIWEADVDNARLETLGYRSVEEFQRANGLPLNGLDAPTRARLQQAEAALVARFEAVDLAVRRSDTTVQSASDNIRSFQKIIGAEETGVFSPDVRAEFENYVKVDFPVIKELQGYKANLSRSLVLKVKSSVGDPNLYTLYWPYGKLYEGNSVSGVSASISRVTPSYENVYLDLDFPSQTKAEAFKTSFDISQARSGVTLVEGPPAGKEVLFSSSRTFEIANVTEPVLVRGEYSSTVGLKSAQVIEANKSWKVRAASRMRATVIKFTDAFRNIIGRRERQSLAEILERARAADEARSEKLDVRLSFIGEFGEIDVVETSFGRSIRIIAD